MANETGAGTFASSPPAGGEGAAMLEKLAVSTTESISPRLDGMFASSDDQLFDLASRAKSNNDQNLYFEALREVRAKKGEIGTDFCRRLAEGFLTASRPAPQPTDPNTQGARKLGSLELVGNEELEKDVVVIDMVSKARMEWQDELFQLGQRMQVLAGRPLEDREVPIDPERIARAFVEACDLLHVDIKILKLLFKQFDRHVMRKLDDLYTLLNQLLVDGGVLPDLKPLSSQKQSRRADTPAAGKAAAAGDLAGISAGGSSSGSGSGGSSAGSTGSAPSAGGVPAQGQGLEGIPDSEPRMRELAQLLVRLRGGGMHAGDGIASGGTDASYGPGASVVYGAGAPGSTGTALRREELVTLISEVQGKALSEPGGVAQPLDIRQAIGAIVESKGRVAVGQGDEDIINVISMFFDLVLEDRNLPPEVKALVSRLQLPILRVALVDRGFFTDRKHPARQLINEIARSSMGWDTADKESQDELFVRLTAMVDEILSSPEDAGIFERSLATLIGVVERYEQRAAKAIRRTSERALADARTTKARDMARQVLHERLESRQLPAEITAFLVEDWLQVLQLVYLKNGKDGVEWNTAVQVADDLLWSVEPHRDEKSRRRLERLLPSLYDRILVGLDQTQSTPEEARARIEVIRRVHQSLAGVAPDVMAPVAPLSPEQLRRITPMPSPDEKAWREMTAVERQRVQHEALMFEYLKRADEVPVGTWFEYDDLRQSVTRRCKLAVRIDETQALIFVNRLGVQVHEKPRKAFAYDLQMGHARPLEDAPLFDRTVDRITSNLRKLTGE